MNIQILPNEEGTLSVSFPEGFDEKLEKKTPATYTDLDKLRSMLLAKRYSSIAGWHMDESLLQRAVREAIVKAGITKPASCHSDIRTTMVYTHVLNRRAGEVVSPLDRM